MTTSTSEGLNVTTSTNKFCIIALTSQKPVQIFLFYSGAEVNSKLFNHFHQTKAQKR